MAGCGQGHRPVAAEQAVDPVIGHALSHSTAARDPWFSGARPAGHPSFCWEAPLVRDFGLSQLPWAQEPPKTGDLPFGPKTVSLESNSADPILGLGQGFGYRLGSDSYGQHTPLHWTLSARLLRVDDAGRPVREIEQKVIRVGTISAGEERRVYLKPSRRPGFYRYDLHIDDRRGAELAHYEKYVRVIPTLWKVRLGLDKRKVKPGQTVLSRVENLGSVTPAYGEDFGVQRHVNGRWVKPPKLPIGTWLAWLGATGPGEAGRCSRLKLPADFPDGRYRVIKWVNQAAGRRVRLVAPFEVVGHASVLERAQARAFRLTPELAARP
jgi:hypothetical protein